MARCGAVLLEGLRAGVIVHEGAHQFYGRVLQAVEIDKEAFVEVNVAVHLLRVVLVH